MPFTKSEIFFKLNLKRFHTDLNDEDNGLEVSLNLSNTSMIQKYFGRFFSFL